MPSSCRVRARRADSVDSHYQKFVGVREEYERLLQKNPAFAPAFPAATNPVLRRPPRPEGRVWLENPEAIAVVDLANAAYGLMVRLLAYAYALHGPSAEKALTVDLAICLMRAIVPLAERAARLPAGPSNPGCNAGMSFTALRDAAPLPPGVPRGGFLLSGSGSSPVRRERCARCGDPRAVAAADLLASVAKRARRGFDLSKPAPAGAAASATAAAMTEARAAQALGAQAVNGAHTGDAAQTSSYAAPAQTPRAANDSHGLGGGKRRLLRNQQVPAPASTIVNGVETVSGQKMELSFETKRCIHARFCVTGAPNVFLANVQGPWIHPDAMEVERVVEVAHACPSGAITYHRIDGVHDETAPPVNLAGIREAGPYAFRGQLQIDGEPVGFRATLCRCGASKNKPFCDGSHHDVGLQRDGRAAER